MPENASQPPSDPQAIASDLNRAQGGNTVFNFTANEDGKISAPFPEGTSPLQPGKQTWGMQPNYFTIEGDQEKGFSLSVKDPHTIEDHMNSAIPELSRTATNARINAQAGGIVPPDILGVCTVTPDYRPDPGFACDHVAGSQLIRQR